jgi:hypothetical protein
MGTSTRIPGPRADAGPWRAAHRRLRDWQRATASAGGFDRADGADRADDAAAREASGAVAAAYLDALATHLRAEPRAFGLEAALQAAGVRLSVVLPRFVHDQHERRVAGNATNARTAEALRDLVDRVAGDGALVVDSAIRRAATRAGAHAVARLRAGLDPAGVPPAAGESPQREAFCAAYALFFADAVHRFLATLMAERGPAGSADAVGESIVARGLALVPSPCAATGGDPSPGALGERAAALVDVAVRRVLGLSPGSGRAA